MNKAFAWQQAIRISIAMMIAMLLEQFILKKNGWTIITVLVVLQTTRGTPLRQILLYTLLMISGVCCGYLLQQLHHMYWSQLLVILFFIVATSFLLGERLLQNKNYFFIVPFVLSLLITQFVMQPLTWWNLQNILIHIAIGMLISVISIKLIFPVKPQKEFKLSVVYILQRLQQNFIDIKNFISTDANLTVSRENLVSALLSDNNNYPEWIYEAGFNPGLRSGFRFFLLQVERLAEIFFSIQYYLLKLVTVENDQAHQMMQTLQPLFANSLEKTDELFQILILYFSKNKIPETQSDFTSDIDLLEKTASDLLPPSLELLDISAFYLQITALIRDLKDTRTTLLKLVFALP